MANLGAGWERDVEEYLMALGGQTRSDRRSSRTHRQPGSGNKDYALGDVVTNLDFLNDFGQFMVECKHRKDRRGDGKSMTVPKAELDKIRAEAQTYRMHPIMAIKIKSPVGGDRKPLFSDPINPMNTQQVVMPMGTFLAMLEHMRDLHEQASSSKEPVTPAPSLRAKECRACRRALDKAVETVRRTMGG